MMDQPQDNDVRIFDTTLRDGEQAPGCSMNSKEKIAMARQLEKLGVDVIEAGFANSSDDDFVAIREISREVVKPVVLSLSRTKEPDIKKALKSVEHAKHPGIHIFIATSDIHLEKKLGMSRQEVLDAACWAIEYAKKHIDHIEFSAEDASRSDRDYLVTIFGEAVRCGATVLNVPDTTGYAIPREFRDLFRYLIESTLHSGSVRWSAHCHDDLGLAVANSLAAIEGGARQVECTINGIGERAGNASLEEIVMALKIRNQCFAIDTNINTREIFATSQLLSHIIGISVPPNKAIVGENAFRHEAGIHQDGGLKDPTTYQIIEPESVGRKSDWLVLGKHSGRHALYERLKQLGVDFETVDMNKVFERFKEIAERKDEIYAEDLRAIVTEEQVRVPELYELLYLNANTSSMAMPHASVKLRIAGEERFGNSVGDGTVDACYKTIAQLIGFAPKLERYAVKAITGGTDALGEVSCLIYHDGISASGQGAHTDIIQASALAFVNALNKLAFRQRIVIVKNGEQQSV
ncbi:MAG TPA: 2-isopropylmalate synthase [Candidatus Paceibacterota bacterium]